MFLLLILAVSVLVSQNVQKFGSWRFKSKTLIIKDFDIEKISLKWSSSRSATLTQTTYHDYVEAFNIKSVCRYVKYHV